jgi:two-component system, NarL family, response regulator DesR
MPRVLVTERHTLLHGGMAAILAQEGMDVVMECARGEALLEAVGRVQPAVVVADLPTLGDDPRWRLARLRADHPGTALLLLVDPRESRSWPQVIPPGEQHIGVLATTAAPELLTEAVDRLSRGEAFLDAEVGLAALSTPEAPLTSREIEVLRIAAEGVPAAEIADRLFLAIGTVRNHMSRILTKMEARTKVEAIRKAQEAGWI